MAFKKAERKNSKLRLAISGPAGSGKTYTAIQIARLLSDRVAMADSERSSGEKYAKKNGTEERPGNWEFDHANLEDKRPQEYLEKIREAAAAGYGCLILDSYSHAWRAALEIVDQMGGWVKAGKVVSPLLSKLTDAILNYPGHVIATLRSVPDHVIEKDEKTGKATMRKVGMATVARDGTDYEFDVMLDLGLDGTITVMKTRCSELAGGIFTRADVPAIVDTLKSWLDEGVTVPAREELARKIHFAADQKTLEALIPELKQLPADDLAELKKAYTKKKLEIAEALG